jgi:hypothetical protein
VGVRCRSVCRVRALSGPGCAHSFQLIPGKAVGVGENERRK